MKYIMLGLYPFIGTTIGSMFVFFVKDKLNHKIEKMMLSIASGVMLASAFFSLLIPSIELSKSLNNFMFIPPILGFGLGFIVFIIFDHFVVKKNKDKIMMPLVVTLHNIPEGMAVGVSIASLLIDTISGNFKKSPLYFLIEMQDKLFAWIKTWWADYPFTTFSSTSLLLLGAGLVFLLLVLLVYSNKQEIGEKKEKARKLRESNVKKFEAQLESMTQNQDIQ